MLHTVEIDLGGRSITLETGKMAKQANGAVVVRSGDSVVLVTACMAERAQTGSRILPAHRRLPRIHLRRREDSGRLHQTRGPSLGKRSSHQPPDRPAHPAAVPRRVSRTRPRSSPWCSRPIRSRTPTRWPSWAPRAALAISDIPFPYVLGGVRVGMKNGQYLANPTYTEGRESQAQHHRGRHRRWHRDGGSRRATGLRSGGARRHRIRPRVLQEDRRRHPRVGGGGRQAQADLQPAAARPGALRPDFTQPRAKTSPTRSTPRSTKSSKATRWWLSSRSG